MLSTLLPHLDYTWIMSCSNNISIEILIDQWTMIDSGQSICNVSNCTKILKQTGKRIIRIFLYALVSWEAKFYVPFEVFMLIQSTLKLICWQYLVNSFFLLQLYLMALHNHKKIIPRLSCININNFLSLFFLFLSDIQNHSITNSIYGYSWLPLR